MEQRVENGRGARALSVALVITAVIMIVEVLGAFWTNSLALAADAGHMLTDVAALGLSLFAVWFTRRPATPQQTYGYFRVEILAALLNGVSLVVIALLIFYEAYLRFLNPQDVRTREMIAIGVVGLAANVISALVLHGSHMVTLNVRAAFLHVIGDILGSLAVIAAGVAIAVWGAFWADPTVSAFVSLLILVSAWRLVRDSVLVLLEGTPSHVNVAAMRQALLKVDGVESIHDLHVWTLSSGVHVMTCHAVVQGEGNTNAILSRLSEVSRNHFGVHHTTIQIEDPHLCRGNRHACP